MTAVASLFKKISLLVALMAFGAANAMAEEASIMGTPIPYKNTTNTEDEITEIWKGWDQNYLASDDGARQITIAHMTDAKGRKVTVSTIYSSFACGATQCPLRATIDGDLVVNGLYCNDLSNHFLVASKSSLFLCDISVPLQTEADKAEEEKP